MKKLPLVVTILFVLCLTVAQVRASAPIIPTNETRLTLNKTPSVFSNLTPEYAPDQIIVKFKEAKMGAFALSPDSSVSALNSKYSASSQKLLVNKSSRKDLDRLYLLKFPKNSDIQSIIADYKKDPNIEYAEPNYMLHIINTYPDDSNFSLQWGLNNSGQLGGTPGADINAPAAWDINTGSKNVVVAIIDTGVDYTVPDLAANMWVNPVDGSHGWNFITNTNDPMDDHGHGTHVAGIIGAVGNNSMGVVGVNWKVKIAALKFLDSGGYGWTSDAVNAVNWANLMGFKITSNSWGGGSYSQALYDAINAAGANDVLFIAAAGNSASNNDGYSTYPCTYSAANIICVAATDNKDALTYFSNYGAITVDIAAPGQDIYSTVPIGSCELCDSSGYKYLSGTSMATPFVSGAAALIKSAFPALNSTQIKTKILYSGEVIASLQGKVLSGRRLNVYSILQDDTTPPAAVSDLNVVSTSLTNITLSWTAVGDNGATGTATAYDIRYSTSQITGSNFDSATQLSGLPAPQASGSTETFTAGGTSLGSAISPGTTYYFAMKVYDDVGNPSPISNVVSGTTTALPSVPGCDVLVYSTPYIINLNNTKYCLLADIISTSGNGVNFANYVQNATLDCRGFTIYGPGSYYYGIYLMGYSTKNVIKNCRITNFYYGIALYLTTNNTLTNITTYSNTMEGIDLDTSSNNTITNTTSSNSPWGIYLYWYSSNNTIKDSVFQNNSYYGIYVSYSSGGYGPNSFYNNLINNTYNVGLGGGYANYWNTTSRSGTRVYSSGMLGGNYWTNPSGSGYSDTCVATGGFCNNPYDVLNDQPCTAGLTCSPYDVDYLPYASVASGLTGLWHFNEGSGTTTADSSSTGNTATITGAAWNASGKSGSALQFNGVNNYVRTANNIGITGASPRTISAWVNIPAGQTGQTGEIAGWGNCGSLAIYYLFVNNGQYELNYYGNDFYFGAVSAGWHHIAVTYDGTNLRGYIDGTLTNTSGSITLSTTDAQVSIGARYCGYWQWYFTGTIDEVRVHNKELSASEISDLYQLAGQWHFNEGSGTTTADSSGNGNTATITGAAWTSGYIGNALSYTSNSYVQTANNIGITGASPRTISAWVNIPAGQTGQTGEIAGWGDCSTRGNYYLFTDSGQYDLNYWGNDFHFGTVSAGWHHIAVTYDGTNLYGYVDGANIANKTNLEGALNTASTKVRVGARYCSGGWQWYFNGTIDEIRIYNIALTAQQILNLSNYTLIGYWSFNEGSGTTTADSSDNGNTATITGAAWNASGKSGSALQFNGVNNYVRTANNLGITGASPRTLAAWVSIPPWQTTESAVIAGWGDCSTRGNYYLFVNDGQYHLNYYGNDFSFGTVTTGWHHIAVTYDGTNLYGYVDGANVANKTDVEGTLTTANTPLSIGARYCGYWQWYFTGTIDEVRVYSKALSASEVNSLATG